MGLLVMLIDDDKDEHVILESWCTSSDKTIKVVHAYNVEDAMDLCKLLKPDVIFVDYNLSLVNGIECIKILRTQQETINIPVYLYTSELTELLLRAAVNAGANGGIRKSEDETEIIELITSIRK